MKKTILFIVLLFVFSLSNNANEREIVLGQGPLRPGFDQISVDPPTVTYDDDLNELYVYFGSTGTIDLEYLEGPSTWSILIPLECLAHSSTASHTRATPVQPTTASQQAINLSTALFHQKEQLFRKNICFFCEK